MELRAQCCTTYIEKIKAFAIWPIVHYSMLENIEAKFKVNDKMPQIVLRV